MAFATTISSHFKKSMVVFLYVTEIPTSSINIFAKILFLNEKINMKHNKLMEKQSIEPISSLYAKIIIPAIKGKIAKIRK